MINKKIIKPTIKLIILTALIVISAINFQSTIAQSIQDNGELTFIKQFPKEDYILKKFAFISGAINIPGVYEVSDDTKLIDLITLAGGLSSDADPDKIAQELNLSQEVQDSDHIVIPFKQIPNPTTENNSSSLININTASIAELDTLPGVGEATAGKIISGRPYSKIEDLKNISGIGDSKYEQLKDLITVN